MPFSG